MIESNQKTISAGMITTTPSWRRLLETAPDYSIHRIVDQLRLPELGYLHLLEKIIGTAHFSQLCPLVVPVNVELADYIILHASNAYLKPLLHLKDQRKLFRLLWRQYCRRQIDIAKQKWPTDIGAFIDSFLSETVTPIDIHPGEWRYCCLYLTVRYGLSNSSPISEKPKILREVLRMAGMNSSSFEEAVVNRWEAEAHRILSSNTILPHLETIAGAFHSEYKARWAHFSELTNRSEDALSEEYADLSFASSLTVSVSLRTANALEKEGIYIFADLAEVTEGKIRAIPGIGDTAVSEIKSALRKVKQVTEQRETIQRQKLERQRKITHQFEQQQKARNR